MSELDISSLTGAPEFERRCNAFVREVNETIKPKYPDLSIDAINETLGNVERLGERIQQWERVIPAEDRDRFIRSSRRMAERSDKLSAFCNQATVDISDLKGRGRRKLVKQAIVEVRKIVSKYKPGEEYEAIDHSGLYSSAHLSYFFS